MNSGMLLRIGIIAVLAVYGVMHVDQILILLGFVVFVAIFFTIGLVLRKRSRWLQVVVIACIASAAFLSVAMVGSSVGIAIYQFYHYPMESCQTRMPPCLPETEQERLFREEIPRLIILMTVPKPFRPTCETVSPEFCLLEMSYDMAPYNYFAGVFGVVIVIATIIQGMRQKDNEKVQAVTA